MNFPAELQAIRERVEDVRAFVVSPTPSQKDRARLLDAVEKVLEVHRPTDLFEDKVCAECTESNEIFTAAPAPWPCFTVRTINRALEGK